MIGDGPQPVPGLVFVQNVEHGHAGRGFRQQLIDRAFAIRVQHENLPEVSARVAQQLQAVFLGTGQRLLVAIHHARRVILHFAEPDEAHARGALRGIGHGEILKVGVEPGLRVLRQDAVAHPLVQMLRSSRVDVVRRIILGVAFSQNHPHQIVRAGGEILRLHRRVDLVVRLREQMRGIAGLGRVAIGLKRFEGRQYSG